VNKSYTKTSTTPLNGLMCTLIPISTSVCLRSMVDSALNLGTETNWKGWNLPYLEMRLQLKAAKFASIFSRAP